MHRKKPKKLNRIIEGKPLLYPDAVGLKYYRAIFPIINAMLRETEDQVKVLFESPVETKVGNPTKDTSISEEAKTLLNRLHNKFLRIFDRDMEDIALGMMWGVDKASAAALAGSLRSMGDSLNISADFLTAEMKDKFEAMTIANVGLFKTILPTHFAKVEQAVMSSIVSGNGLQDLNPFFQDYSNGTKNYAKLRAMDQTRKAYTCINMERMKALGVTKFEWIHSHGSNDPRKLHQDLDGKVFAIDTPPFIGDMYSLPVYGYPGQLPNCRCLANPVFEFDEN